MDTKWLVMCGLFAWIGYLIYAVCCFTIQLQRLRNTERRILDLERQIREIR